MTLWKGKSTQCLHEDLAMNPNRLFVITLAFSVSSCAARSPAMPDADTLENANATIEMRPLGAEPWARREYTHRTTQALRDGLPSHRIYQEPDGLPFVRTGSRLFDGLFALAMTEVRENSVSSIRDGAFHHDQPIPCECFETGRLWHFVWTRDTAYATDLALAMLDPLRAANSLSFKVSERQEGTGRRKEIIQDTGSGGSWPVSTDRVTWALGAARVLDSLSGVARSQFLDLAYPALVNTLDTDRRAVFDARDGLYRGEQSFLDWRQQSYASWMHDDTVHIATSKSLSTNVAHLMALSLAARLSREKGDEQRAVRFGGWAAALREAIRALFWSQEDGMYRSLTAPELDGGPLSKFELLGNALAILAGVADEQQARAILSHYPVTEAGAPVLWPQQPDMAIYHNRAIWPFVSSYGVLAAKKARHGAFAAHGIRSLVRGAALNLSNMENLEFLTGLPFVSDGEFSGPVVNSQRQLWSVAGYAAMVIRVVFGVEVQEGALVIEPFVPADIRKEFFGGAHELTLRDLQVREKRVHVTLRLPEGESGRGNYLASEIRVNGVERRHAAMQLEDLEDGAQIEVKLHLQSDDETLRIIKVKDPGALLREEVRALWAPREPRLSIVERTPAGVRVSVDRAGESGTVLRIFRDGCAAGTTDGEWFDPEPITGTVCYTAEQSYAETGNTSHRSKPQCIEEGVIRIGVENVQTEGEANLRFVYGRKALFDWGAPGARIVVGSLEAPRSGSFLLSVLYQNGWGPLSTGVTAAAKLAQVRDAESGALVGEGVLGMPHLRSWEAWGESTFVPMRLLGGRRYRIEIEDFANMSAFEIFRLYTAGAGGAGGMVNRAHVAELVVRSRE